MSAPTAIQFWERGKVVREVPIVELTDEELVIEYGAECSSADRRGYHDPGDAIEKALYDELLRRLANRISAKE